LKANPTLHSDAKGSGRFTLCTLCAGELGW